MPLRSLIAVAMLLAVACSSPDRAGRMSPTAPSAARAVQLNDIGGIVGPMDLRFPPRNETLEARNMLEAPYQNTLNRSINTQAVDREGEVVWLQEYIRYRVNGCDHETAIRNVFAQIDQQAAPAVCAENRNYVAIYPPRNETLDFRHRLEAKYASMGRAGITTYVDLEGQVIWTQEYLRYRSNECSHDVAVQKVAAQIAGAPPSETCVPACRYRVSPSTRNLAGGQQGQSVDLIGEPGGCEWTATSDVAWLTFPSNVASVTTGRNDATLNYTVLQNVSGGARTGRIVFSWAGGSSTHTVNQDGNALITSFTMVDSFRSAGTPTTECHLRSTATPCTFTATSNLPGGGAYTYIWTATYLYGTTQKTVTQTGTSNQFTITDACNAPDASATGTHSDLDVTLTVLDSLGNTQTVRSAQGDQPALRVVKFTC